MKIIAVVMRRLALPLRRPFRTAGGELTRRDVVVLEVRTSDGVGWGECAALPEPTYTAEYVEGAESMLRRFLLPMLLAAPSAASADVAAILAAVKGHPMAKAAVEMAVLDAELRAAGRSLASWLGGVRDSVEVGVAVGRADSIAEQVHEVAEQVARGYRRVKLKIAPGWDVEPVAAVRDRFGDGLALQVDGNCAYPAGAAEHLVRLDRFGLVLVEQPFAADDLAAHARLASLMATPVCLDESVTSVPTAAAAIGAGACSVINIKSGRVGGYLEARRIHDVCVASGVDVWCGGMLETGLGRAANLALASLPGFTLPGDISGSDRWYAEDITTPRLAVNGRMLVPSGPGIGAVPLAEALDAFTTSSYTALPP
ncbi:o-succinylbenzoate synthase [soil metagenome]